VHKLTESQKEELAALQNMQNTSLSKTTKSPKGQKKQKDDLEQMHQRHFAEKTKIQEIPDKSYTEKLIDFWEQKPKTKKQTT